MHKRARCWKRQAQRDILWRTMKNSYLIAELTASLFMKKAIACWCRRLNLLTENATNISVLSTKFY